MKKHLAWIVTLLAVLGVGGVAWANSSFLTEVAKFAGEAVANKLAAAGLLNVDSVKVPVQPEVKLGAGAHNRSVAQRVTLAMTENASTTCAMQNNDGVVRFLTAWGAFFNADDTSSLNGNSTGTQALPSASVSFEFDVTTSTNAFTTTTGKSIFLNQYFATSTLQQVFVSTTFGITNTINPLIPTSSFVNARQWNNGEWLNMKLNGPSSSTGQCFADFISNL